MSKEKCIGCGKKGVIKTNDIYNCPEKLKGQLTIGDFGA